MSIISRGIACNKTNPAALPGDPGCLRPTARTESEDFCAVTGARAAARREEVDASGFAGWYEVYAADGYRLRCDWSRMGSREELRFAEIGPQQTEGASDQHALACARRMLIASRW